MPKIKNDSVKNKKLCQNCSMCCEYVNITIRKPQSKKALDLVIWYILHGLSVHIDSDGYWMVYLPFQCKELKKDKNCGIYSDRPSVCREYSQLICEKYDKNDNNSWEFSSKKEFLKYINSNPKLKAIYNRKVNN